MNVHLCPSRNKFSTSSDSVSWSRYKTRNLNHKGFKFLHGGSIHEWFYFCSKIYWNTICWSRSYIRSNNKHKAKGWKGERNTWLKHPTTVEPIMHIRQLQSWLKRKCMCCVNFVWFWNKVINYDEVRYQTGAGYVKQLICLPPAGPSCWFAS